jgi:hypothetical protein
MPEYGISLTVTPMSEVEIPLAEPRVAETPILKIYVLDIREEVFCPVVMCLPLVRLNAVSNIWLGIYLPLF